MKKLNLLLVLFMMMVNVSFGQGILVHRKDGKVIKIKLENVDSVSFTMEKNIKEAYVFDTISITIVDTMVIENGDTIMKERPCYVFYGATNVLPNNSDEITKHQNITLNAQQHTTSMISNKNNFLFTAVPKNYYKVVNWKDDLGTSIFDYFSNPEATICFVLPVNITSEKFSLNEEPYEVYITGRQDENLNQTSHTATISKK